LYNRMIDNVTFNKVVVQSPGSTTYFCKRNTIEGWFNSLRDLEIG